MTVLVKVAPFGRALKAPRVMTARIKVAPKARLEGSQGQARSAQPLDPAIKSELGPKGRQNPRGPRVYRPFRAVPLASKIQGRRATLRSAEGRAA